MTENKCEACEGNIKHLSFEEAFDLQSSTPLWSILVDEIIRDFKFDDFAQALEFVNKIGKIAEKEGHHPDINMGWGYVNVMLTTHAIKGLSKNDFIVAAKIDKAL